MPVKTSKNHLKPPNIFLHFLALRTPQIHPTSCVLSSPKSNIKSHESLFCCWKRDNRDVAHRSAVEPVPGVGQARQTPKSAGSSARFHANALPKRHSDRTCLA